MVQGGLHREVAVCEGTPGLPVDQPIPRLAIAVSPQPIHTVCFCTGASWDGDRVMRHGGHHGPPDARRGPRRLCLGTS